MPDPQRSRDEIILERLVALNAERAAEEARGQVRWLRPEYQTRAGQTRQAQLDVDEAEPATAKSAAPAEKLVWPQALPEQARVLRRMLAA